jgi:hypothetical protein
MLNPIPRHKDLVTLFRCFTSLLALLLLLVPKQNAIAQTSIYGSVALVDYGFQNNNNYAAKSDTAGFVGGVFYNFPIQSRLTAGVDVRGSYGVGSRGGALAAGALRIGFVPERVVLRPYSCSEAEWPPRLSRSTTLRALLPKISLHNPHDLPVAAWSSLAALMFA